MILTPIYNIIEEQLKEIEGIKFITWWNGQTADRIIHATPAVYVAFPNPIATQTMGDGRSQQGILRVRIYLVTKILSTNEGGIKASVMSEHEQNALLIYNALQRLTKPLNEDFVAINSMNRTNAELNMDTPGMAITIQDFETRYYQADSTPKQTVTAQPQIIRT